MLVIGLVAFTEQQNALQVATCSITEVLSSQKTTRSRAVLRSWFCSSNDQQQQRLLQRYNDLSLQLNAVKQSDHCGDPEDFAERTVDVEHGNSDILT